MDESNLPATNDHLLKTTTGELMQLIRLQSELFNKKEMLRIFKKLGCIEFDPPRRRWPWVYDRGETDYSFEDYVRDLMKAKPQQ